MNNLSATGGIGKDAELRYTPSGDAICSFSFALSSGFGDKKVTTWLNCNVWGSRAETLAPMLLKGTKVGIVGELTNRPYKDKNGNEKFSQEVRVSDLTLLGSKGDTSTSTSNNNASSTPKNAPVADYEEEALPF